MTVLMVKCDINDADYVHAINEIDDSDIPIIKSIATKIAAFRPYVSKSSWGMMCHHHHNFPQNPREDMGGKTMQQLYDFTEDEINLINEYFPCSLDSMYAHTLHSIDIIEVKESLFKLDSRAIYG